MLRIAYKKDENGKFDLKLYEIAIWEKITKKCFNVSRFAFGGRYDMTLTQKNNTISIVIRNWDREDLPSDGITVFKRSIPAGKDDFFDNEFFEARHIGVEEFMCELSVLVEVLNAGSYRKDPEFLKDYTDIIDTGYLFQDKDSKRVECDNCGATFHDRRYNDER